MHKKGGDPKKCLVWLSLLHRNEKSYISKHLCISKNIVFPLWTKNQSRHHLILLLSKIKILKKCDLKKKCNASKLYDTKKHPRKLTKRAVIRDTNHSARCYCSDLSVLMPSERYVRSRRRHVFGSQSCATHIKPSQNNVRVRIPYSTLYYYRYEICIFINRRMSAVSWGICADNVVRANYVGHAGNKVDRPIAFMDRQLTSVLCANPK